VGAALLNPPSNRQIGLVGTEHKLYLNARYLVRRLLKLDIETCDQCGGAVKVVAPVHSCARNISASMHVIASIEDPAVVKRILDHLEHRSNRRNPNSIQCEHHRTKLAWFPRNLSASAWMR